MKHINLLLIACATFLMIDGTGCKKGSGLNIFSVQDDITLGQQTADKIAADPVTYPILSKTQYASTYSYVTGLRDKILATGQLTYKDQFPWTVDIIRDDNTLNAFCVPGGHIYVYTGLIKYLDTEDELAGVMGHEMAHADRRHVTKQMTEQYGITTLLNVVLGSDTGTLTRISTGLLTLAFSRSDESEADKYSVIYLCGTNYNAAGAAGFFQKLIDLQQTGNTPQFLSTHPNPDNRVAAINSEKTTLGCTGTATNQSAYAAFKAALP